MVDSGLSPSLISCLEVLSTEIPEFKFMIQEGLIRLLTQVLLKPAPTTNGATTHVVTNEALETRNTVLALKVLGKFDFKGRSVMQFVKTSSDVYISSPQKEVRLEAVKTICHLLIHALNSLQEKYSSILIQTVQEVLGKILNVAVTDSDPQVRYSVLASLDERFDNHLAQADNLNALFLSLNDEVFENPRIGLV